MSIGNILGIHHATVIYSIEKIKDYISIKDKETLKIFKMICVT